MLRSVPACAQGLLLRSQVCGVFDLVDRLQYLVVACVLVCVVLCQHITYTLTHAHSKDIVTDETGVREELREEKEELRGEVEVLWEEEGLKSGLTALPSDLARLLLSFLPGRAIPSLLGVRHTARWLCTCLHELDLSSCDS